MSNLLNARMARLAVTLTMIAATVLLVNSWAIGDDDDGGSGGSTGGPPMLELYDAENPFDNIWILTGQVWNADPVAGLTVDLGGLAAGESTTTDYDGSFYHVVFLSGSGDITAVVTSAQGEQSELESIYVN